MSLCGGTMRFCHGTMRLCGGTAHVAGDPIGPRQREADRNQPCTERVEPSESSILLGSFCLVPMKFSRRNYG